jgi:hypothetical protein
MIPRMGEFKMKGFVMTNSNMSEWIDLKAASIYASVSISWMRRQIESGKLRCARTGDRGSKILVKKEWIDALLNGESK